MGAFISYSNSTQRRHSFVIWLTIGLVAIIIWQFWPNNAEESPKQSQAAKITARARLLALESGRRHKTSPLSPARKTASLPKKGADDKSGTPLNTGTNWLREKNPELAEFSAWANRFQEASPTERNLMTADGVALVQIRHELMTTLIATDPAQAIAYAIPDASRESMPVPIQNLLEKRISGVGNFEVIGVLPSPEAHYSGPYVERYVDMDGRTYKASVYGDMASWGTLNDVLIDGIVLDGQIALGDNPGRTLAPWEQLDPAKPLIANHPVTSPRTSPDSSSGSPSTYLEMSNKIYCGCCFWHGAALQDPLVQYEQLGTAAATSRAYSNLGSKIMLLIPVEFQDKTGSPWSSHSIKSDRKNKLENYCNTVSYGKLSLTTTSAPLQQLDQNASFYDFDTNAGRNTLKDHATAKADDAGYKESDYDFVSIVVNHNMSTEWAGYGQVGNKFSWIDGSSSGSGQDQAREVFIHELGHNLGLWHSNAWDPATTIPDDSNGTHIEYGYDFDIMGDTWTYNDDQLHFNASFKNALDWLTDSYVTAISSPSTVTLHAMDQNLVSGRTYAVRIPTSFTLGSNSNLDYWIEARSRYPSVTSVENGVLIYVNDSDSSDEALKLLDMAPATSSVVDAGLRVGNSFTTEDSKWKITVDSVSGSGTERAFSISIDDARLPAITAQPSNLSVREDNNGTFSVTATGPDLLYQWHKDSVAITGATSSSYTIVKAAKSDEGTFYVTITNSNGSATSDSVTFTIDKSTGDGGGCGSMPFVNLLAITWGGFVLFKILSLISITRGKRRHQPNHLMEDCKPA